MRAKTAGQVFCFDIEEIPHDSGGKAIQEFAYPGNILCFDASEPVGNDHVVRFLQNGREEFGNIFGIELSVGIDVDHAIGAVFQGAFHGLFERVGEATVRFVGNDDIGSGVFGDLCGLVG